MLSSWLLSLSLWQLCSACTSRTPAPCPLPTTRLLRVTGVEIDASGETPELGGTAAETLADQLTKAGSTSGVDAVAGATMTSDAVFTAMDNCLSQAE